MNPIGRFGIQPFLRDSGFFVMTIPALKRRAIVACPFGTLTRRAITVCPFGILSSRHPVVETPGECSIVPPGLWVFRHDDPGVETPGYCQVSLRDHPQACVPKRTNPKGRIVYPKGPDCLSQRDNSIIARRFNAGIDSGGWISPGETYKGRLNPMPGNEPNAAIGNARISRPSGTLGFSS